SGFGVRAWGGRYFSSDAVQTGREFVAIDRVLDECRVGPTYVRRPEIAQLVVEELRSGMWSSVYAGCENGLIYGSGGD
ncbi:MAG TPA: hypothetical protein VE621_17130, partial [Bryobacteraceae bacterium]|nr:hypothetical protein [Bryobacteraceae bacterium]